MKAKLGGRYDFRLSHPSRVPRVDGLPLPVVSLALDHRLIAGKPLACWETRRLSSHLAAEPPKVAETQGLLFRGGFTLYQEQLAHTPTSVHMNLARPSKYFGVFRVSSREHQELVLTFFQSIKNISTISICMDMTSVGLEAKFHSQTWYGTRHTVPEAWRVQI